MPKIKAPKNEPLVRPKKAVILMGGESSRFWPLNYAGHKALFKLLGKTILEHTLDSLTLLGASELILVRSVTAGVSEINKKYPAIREIIQKKPHGMGDALELCQKFISKKETFLVVNPYHFNIHEALQDLNFNKPTLFGKKEEKNIKDYGVLKIAGSGHKKYITDIEEKPARPKSNIKIVGMYVLDGRIFSYLSRYKGHYSFEQTLGQYIKHAETSYREVKIDLPTLKYPWHILKIKDLILKKITVSRIEGKIKQGAFLDESSGPIVIEKGATIHAGAILKGPLYIGKNCIIGNHSLVRECILEKGVIIGCQAEAARSVFSAGSSMHSGYIGDSIIGENTHIGAGFITANKRLDKTPVKAMVKNEKINTKIKALGIIAGRKSSIGIRSCSMPGIFIGNKSFIFPCSLISKNIYDNEIFKESK